MNKSIVLNFWLQNFEGSLLECNKVLGVDENNVKAFFRRGQAYLGQQDYDQALKSFVQAQQLAPNDKGVLKEIAKVKQAQQKQKEKEKAMYSKMFK